MRRSALSAVIAVSLLAAACSGDDSSEPSDDRGPATESTSTESSSSEPAATGAEPASEPSIEQPPPDAADDGRADEPEMPPQVELGTLSPGVEQVALTGAPPGRTAGVVEDSAETIDGYLHPAPGVTFEPLPGGEVDELGSLLVRGLNGGSDYRLLYDDGTVSPAFTTLARDEHPAPAFYAEQRLPTDGLGYITVRDGTTLSASVWLPGPADDGPYPTVVEYSGYTPSDPASSGFADVFTAMGYAYVGVNIRGTGCSGDRSATSSTRSRWTATT